LVSGREGDGNEVQERGYAEDDLEDGSVGGSPRKTGCERWEGGEESRTTSEERERDYGEEGGGGLGADSPIHTGVS
jgi:hypothetical protein